MDCMQYWKPYMEHSHTCFTDATVYESYIEYPTDAKLLWKSCCDVLQLIKTGRKNVKIRHTHINHEKHKTQYLSFGRRRKKSKRQSKKICRSLLKYLLRLINQLDELTKKHTVTISASQYNRLTTIRKLIELQ